MYEGRLAFRVGEIERESLLEGFVLRWNPTKGARTVNLPTEKGLRGSARETLRTIVERERAGVDVRVVIVVQTPVVYLLLCWYIYISKQNRKNFGWLSTRFNRNTSPRPERENLIEIKPSFNDKHFKNRRSGFANAFDDGIRFWQKCEPIFSSKIVQRKKTSVKPQKAPPFAGFVSRLTKVTKG